MKLNEYLKLIDFSEALSLKLGYFTYTKGRELAK